MGDSRPAATESRRGRRAAPRARARSFGSRTAVASAVAVAATVAVAAMVPARQATQAAVHPPKLAGLTDVTLVCPPNEFAKATTLLASGPGVAGDVQVALLGETPAAVAVTGAAPVTIPTGGAGARVSAAGEVAAGLAAGTVGAKPLAGTSCQNPEPDHWFSGLGASPRHSTRLMLINPDPGPAVADLTVYGSLGVVDAPELRGVAVPGGESVVLDLAARLPSRGALGVHVATVRGRLGVFAADAVDDLGRGEARREWIAPSTRASATSLIPGLAGSDGTQVLTLLNPGDSQAVVTLKILTDSSSFTPAEGAQVEVPATAVVEVPLTSALSASAARGALGIEIDSSQPLVSALRSATPKDLAWSVDADPIDGGLTESGAAFLGARPAKGEAVLALAAISTGSGRTGKASATVQGFSSAGDVVLQKELALATGLGTKLKLPETVTWVWVTVSADTAAGGLRVSGAVRIEGTAGVTVLPLTPVASEQRVPHVSAGSDLLAP